MRLLTRTVVLALLLAALRAAATDPQYVTGQAAVTVLGQRNFSANRPGNSAQEFGTVSGLAVAGNMLIVCDGSLPFAAPSNHRVLIFNNIADIGPGAAASVVVGQDDFGQDTPGLSEKKFNRPVGISTDGQRLVVADAGSNRVLIFNRIPGANGASADVVVGQPDFRTAGPDTTDSRMRGPAGVFTDGRRLFVADTLNHRVLIYNSIPTSNGARADVVLGQANMTARADQAASRSNLRDPTSVFTDGARLIVTDLGHNRVLIWNSIPTSNNAPADLVVGQADFDKDAAGTGPASMNFPRHAFINGTRLFVADTGNNRVLVYNQVPTANGVAADAGLGQKDFIITTDTEQDDPERLSSGLMRLPMALAPVPDGGILVADTNHRRILKFIEGVPLFPRGGVVSAASFGGNGLARPTNVQVEVQTDGSLPEATYYIKVTAEGGILFESVPSEEVSVAAPANSKLIVTFDEVPGATAYRAYIGGAPGGQTRYFTTEIPTEGEAINRRVEITTLATINLGGPRLEITPGGIAALFGADLAPRLVAAESLPLPRELGGVSVLVNGIEAPLFFVSPNQINFQVPVELDGTSASVMVRQRTPSGTLLSTAVPVPISELTPGLFTVSGDGTGRLLAFHADFTPVSDQAPIVAGENLVFFGTGVQKISLPGPALATVTFDLRSRGELRVTREGQVTWSTTFADVGRVFVSTDGGAEALFAEGASGTQTADFITAGHLYRFVLKPVSGGVLDPPVAVVLIDTRTPSLGDPSGQIQLEGGVVTWSTTNVPSAGVFVSIDGGPETLVTEGTSGTRAPEFITHGHHYRFNLRQVIDGISGDLLGSADADNFQTGAEGQSGQISIDQDGKITWSTTNVTAGRVTMSVDGGAESVYVEGTSGDKAADSGFFFAGRFYRFVLRVKLEAPPVTSGEPSPPGTFIDTTASVAIQDRDAPIQFGGYAPGQVGLLQFNVRVADDLEMNGEEAEVRVFIGAIPANQVFLPVRDDSRGEITVTPEGLVTWSSTNVTAAAVYVSVDDGEEQLFSNEASGSGTADFLEEGHIYRFILRKVVGGQPGRVLAEATVDKR